VKFKYNNILHIPTPHKTHLQVGTGIHAVYEEMARQKMQGKTPLISECMKMLDDTWDGSALPVGPQEKQETLARWKRCWDFWFRLSRQS
jgi:DNA helicase-2/ATP-dependent DNA helicase PcrA